MTALEPAIPAPERAMPAPEPAMPAPAARARLARDAIAPAVLFAGLALVPLATGETWLVERFLRVVIFAIAAVGLDLVAGYGGLISFGHAAFVGIGAYAVGIMAAHGIHEIGIVLPAVLAASGMFALFTGFVSLRTRGAAFIMITLAFGQMSFFTAASLAPYGGDDGLTIRMRDTLAGYPVFGSVSGFYYVALACLLAAYLFCRALLAARLGRVFRGAAENPARLAAMGFDVFRFQLVVYVVSGMLGGLAGFLLANHMDFVSPADMSWQRSGDLLIMVILGGVGRLHGAIFGALVFVLTREWLSDVTPHWRVVFGPLLVAVAVFLPGGLGGIAQKITRGLRGE